MAVQPQECTPAVYCRRRPAETPLYRAVQNHLETFLALCRDDWEDKRIAPHAERELRRFLECGILAYGFARAHCARPAFAAERLQELDAHRLIYHLPKPGPDGRTQPILSPLELIERIAALVPPPRVHRHRYYRVLAPHASLRAAVTAMAPAAIAVQRPPVQTSGDAPLDPPYRSPARYLWAMLQARIYEAFPLTCMRCGAEMRIIAFVTEAAPVQRILSHIGEPATPPPIAPARGPP